MNIYLSKNGQTFGPYTSDDIQTYLRDGSIASTDLACIEGEASWTTVANLPFVAPPAHPSLPPLPVPLPPNVSGSLETQWANVPLLRRAWVNYTFAIVGLLLCGLLLLLPICVAFTGNIYSKKLAMDGMLAKWPSSRKFWMVVGFLIWVAFVALSIISPSLEQHFMHQ